MTRLNASMALDFSIADEITIITEPMTDDPNRHNPKKHLFARQTYLPKFRQQEKSSAKLPSSRPCPAAEVGCLGTSRDR
jgi:hypothetical protein